MIIRDELRELEPYVSIAEMLQAGGHRDKALRAWQEVTKRLLTLQAEVHKQMSEVIG